MSLQFVQIFYSFSLLVCILLVYAGFCNISVAFTEDVSDSLDRIEKQIRSNNGRIDKSQTNKIKIDFYKTFQFHSEAKQLSQV